MNRLNVKCFVIGIITGVVSGLFGAGGGTIIVPSLRYFFKLDDHIIHATAIAIIFPLAVISSTFYIHSDFVNWDLVIKASIGGIIGGFIGAKVLKNIPRKYLRILFAFFLIFSSIRMVFY